jgi:hypothetical protein
MKIRKNGIGLLLGFLLPLNGCMFDKTPAEVHAKLVPQIAEELISNQASAKLDGITPEIVESLKSHADEGIFYQAGAPELNCETGIRFYSKKDSKEFLAIGMDLKASMKGYTVVKISDSRFTPEKTPGP